MEFEKVVVERYDHYILPFRRTEKNPVPIVENRVTLEKIGALRLSQQPNGEVSVVAKLLRGVRVRRPGEKTKRIDPLPNAPAKEEPLVLSPENPIELERPRFAKGKSVVTISLRP